MKQTINIIIRGTYDRKKETPETITEYIVKSIWEQQKRDKRYRHVHINISINKFAMDPLKAITKI